MKTPLYRLYLPTLNCRLGTFDITAELNVVHLNSQCLNMKNNRSHNMGDAIYSKKGLIKKIFLSNFTIYLIYLTCHTTLRVKK